MMLPIPKAGVLEEVRGQARARAVPGVTGLEISIARGKPVRALPEADRYLGFLFARGETPEPVERALRTAPGRLETVIGDPSAASTSRPSSPGRTSSRPAAGSSPVGTSR